MKTLFVRALKALALGSALLISIGCLAQEVQKPVKNATTYTIKPDYRKCAFPMCGGWYLTPVNQYSLQLENDDEAYQNSLLVPNTIYVSSINYKALGLTDSQIKEFEHIARSGHALLAGQIIGFASDIIGARRTLVAQSAWTSPTKTAPVGPYLKVSSSGIVCITTPCPYFKADLINSTYSINFHELTFEKAELDREQEARAWQAVSSEGLVLTGVRFVSQGQVGTGTGISATKVFFSFPAKRSIY